MKKTNNREKEYEVEKIIGKKVNGNCKEYLIKWKGYSEDESTWEPESNLENAKLSIEKFESLIKKQEKKLNNKKRIKLNINKNKTKKEDFIINEVLYVFEKNNKLYGKCKICKNNKKIIKIICTDDISKNYPIPLIKYYESKIIFNN